jgi:hypothetical protein
MSNETVLSRRMVLGRVAALALFGLTVPALLTATKAFAEGKGTESHDSVSEGSEGAGDESNESGDDDGAGSVIAPSASAIAPVGNSIDVLPVKKKKRVRK